jgi:ERCC4-type nuclease
MKRARSNASGAVQKVAMPVIVIDSREQRPLTFGAAQETRRVALRSGDYSVAGLVDRVAIERKSLADLYNCVGWSRERFERELARLSALRYAALVVEGTMAEVLDGVPYSRVHPNAVLGSLLAWSVDHRLPIFFCDDRRLAALTVMKLLKKCDVRFRGR